MFRMIEKLKTVVVSLACRLFVLIFGVMLFVFFGVAIVANLINPISWIDFLFSVYIAMAGVFSCVYFFTKRLGHFIVVLPVILYFGVAFLLWSLQ